MFKKSLILIMGIFYFQLGLAQRVVNNIIFPGIDEDYNVTDTIMSNNRLRNALCYQCKTDLFNNDSCFLTTRKHYDEMGRLIELDNGGSKNENDFSVKISYRKISNVLYESIIRYSLSSDVLPTDFYIDTIIKGKVEKVYLCKKDRDNRLYVKSHYILDSSGDLMLIKRYDLDNKLIHLYYPFGNWKPVQQSIETKINEFDSVVTFKSKYPENEIVSTYVYNKKGNICEVKEVNNTYADKRKSIEKKYILYNSINQPIVRATLNKDNQLVSEERFYYDKGRLRKYTEDNDFQDSLLRVERVYNASGQVTFSKEYNKYNANTMTWKYIYNDKGLLEKEMYYLDDIIEIARFYKYN